VIKIKTIIAERRTVLILLIDFPPLTIEVSVLQYIFNAFYLNPQAKNYRAEHKQHIIEPINPTPAQRDVFPCQTTANKRSHYLGQAACVSLGTTRNIPNALKSPAAPPK
jgi:hypothetical protein